MKILPKIKIQLTLIDHIAEAVGWLLLMTIWFITIFFYNDLPEEIPVHFNLSGEANSFANRSLIFFLPVIATLLFLLLTFINKHPDKFKYPVNLTKENVIKQYEMATKMVRYIKLLIMIIFLMIIIEVIQVSHDPADGFGNWFLLFLILIIIFPLIYILIAGKLKEKV